MREEQYTRGNVGPAASDLVVDGGTGGGGGGGANGNGAGGAIGSPTAPSGTPAPAPGPASFGRVDGVPSEQLWRAAILAARQAALAAAEIRRALDETTHPPIPPPIDGTPGVSFLS